MGQFDFTYELPTNFSSIVIQLLRQKQHNDIVWNYSDDTETNADSLIYQEVSSDGYNRIRLDGRGLYLTKNENNNYLCWMSKISSNRQNFKLELVESGQTRISMPVNVNQKYTANDPWIRDYGCAVCCGVDIASWFNKKNYSLFDFKVNVHYYENKNGYQWTGPDGFNFESAVSTASESEAQTIEHLKTRRQPLTASMT